MAPVDCLACILNDYVDATRRLYMRKAGGRGGFPAELFPSRGDATVELGGAGHTSRIQGWVE